MPAVAQTTVPMAQSGGAGHGQLRLAQSDVVAPLPEAPLPLPANPTMAPAPMPSSSRPRPIAAPSRPTAPSVTLAPLPAATTVGPITFTPPARKTVKVTPANKAKAWPLVNDAAKALKAGKTAQALTLYKRAYAIDPTNEYAGSGVATAQVILGRFNEAAATYRAVLAYRPGDMKALRGLADALTYAQKLREAIGVNNVILAKDPKNFAAAYQNGQVATYLRSYAIADKNFERVAQIAPSNPQYADFWSAWGESYSYRRDSRALTAFNRVLNVNPKTPQKVRALIGLGNYYSYIGQFSAAIPEYKKALSLQSRNVTALIGLGEALTYTGDSKDAINPLRSALQLQPNNDRARLGLGRAYVYAGSNDKGLTYLRQVLSRDPGNLQALEASALASPPTVQIATYQKLLAAQSDPAQRARTYASLGDAYAGANKLTEAAQAYGQAAALAPNDPKINLTYAQFLSYNENWAGVRTAAAHVLQLSPDDPQALALQLQAENKAGDPATAKALAAKLENVTPATAEESLALAQALRDAGNVTASQRLLMRAAQTVNDPDTALRLANVTRDAGDYPGAVTLYKNLIAQNPGNKDARLGLALTYIWQSDLANAQAQIDQVKAVDPTNQVAETLASRVLLYTNTAASRDEAVRKANAILQQDPTNPEARAIVGAALSIRARFADAVTQYRAAVDADPNNSEARLGLARNLYYARDVEGSINEYREIIRRAPAETIPRLELAQIFLDRNRFSDAEAMYNEVLAMRRGAGALAAVRRAIAQGTLARLSPQARQGSPFAVQLRTYAQIKPPSRRAVVENPAIKTAVSVKGSKRTLLAQLPTTASGGSDTLPAATAPLTTPADSATTAPAPDTTTTAPAPDTTTATPDTTTTTAPATDTTVPAAPITGSALPATIETVPAFDATATSTAAPVEPAIADQTAAFRGLGEIRRRQDRFTDAQAYFQQALALDPNDANALVGLAQAQRGENDLATALANADKAINIDPSNIPARVVRGQLLADGGQSNLASSELTALLGSVPADAPLETFLQLANALNSVGNYDAAISLLDAASQQYPSDPAPTRLKAEALTFARKYDDALAIYDKLIAADAQDAEAVVGKARVYNYSSRLAEAETTYRQALTIAPDNYQATTELADVVGRRGNYAESIRLYQVAIQANPSDLKTRVELARVQRYSGATADAESTLNDILTADDRNVDALTERGLLRGTLGSYAAGIADLQRALTIAPTNVNAQLGLAEVQSYAGNYPESIAGYKAVLAADSNNFQAQTGLAEALSLSGDNDEALKQINTALAQNPDDINARIIKADVLGRATRTTEAVALYRQILATDPTNVRAQTGLADAFVAGRRFNDAIGVYDRLIVANPDNTSYKVQRARVLGYAGRSKEAVTALRAVVAAEPNNMPARLALAEAGTNSGNPTLLKNAIADYRSILKTDPANTPAKIGLARALSYNGNYNESKTLLKGVLATTPTNNEARLALADAERFSGNNFEARSGYQQVLTAQPTNTSASQGLRLVNRFTSSGIGIAGSYYSDSNNVRYRGISLTPTLRTKGITIGLIGEKGKFSQNGIDRDRRNLGFLLARRFGAVQAQLILSRLRYEGAPEKTLFDFGLNSSRGQRTSYYAGVGRRDIFESDLAVAQGIVATIYRAGFTIPIAAHFDLAAAAQYYRYSDDNSRITVSPSIYYRFKPTNPSLRVGLGFTYDDTKEIRTTPGGVFTYYTPQNYKAASLLADYIVDQGLTRYGITGSLALTGSTGDNGVNRPADTLFGFYERDLNDNFGIFANGGIVRSPDFHSNQINAGVNVYLK